MTDHRGHNKPKGMDMTNQTKNYGKKYNSKETNCNIVSASFFQENIEVDTALSTFTVNGEKGPVLKG